MWHLQVKPLPLLNCSDLRHCYYQTKSNDRLAEPDPLPDRYAGKGLDSHPGSNNAGAELEPPRNCTRLAIVSMCVAVLEPLSW